MICMRKMKGCQKGNKKASEDWQMKYNALKMKNLIDFND